MSDLASLFVLALLMGLVLLAYGISELIKNFKQQFDSEEIYHENKRYTRKDLLDLSSREFEEFSASYIESLGFETTLTKQTGDGGFDVIAFRNGRTILIECKRYKKPVGVKIVREFHSVVTTKKADVGYIFATSEFTKPAREYARSTKYKIRCIGVKRLLDLLHGNSTIEIIDDRE